MCMINEHKNTNNNIFVEFEMRLAWLFFEKVFGEYFVSKVTKQCGRQGPSTMQSKKLLLKTKESIELQNNLSRPTLY